LKVEVGVAEDESLLILWVFVVFDGIGDCGVGVDDVQDFADVEEHVLRVVIVVDIGIGEGRPFLLDLGCHELFA
jgi:hypothetical protein